MIKKKIKYTDYNGVERIEDHYFNLSKPEVAEMELSVDGGLSTMVGKLVETQNNKEIIQIFKDIILKSYGVKSDDGKRFIKSQELTDSFAQTEAYSELFMELATNADAASKFINGITPNMPVEVSKPPMSVPEH